MRKSVNNTPFCKETEKPTVCVCVHAGQLDWLSRLREPGGKAEVTGGVSGHLGRGGRGGAATALPGGYVAVPCATVCAEMHQERAAAGAGVPTAAVCDGQGLPGSDCFWRLWS